jgi:hypothetical protein
VERWFTGRDLGLSMCAGGLFFRAGAACARERPQDQAVANLIATQLAKLGDGSPSVGGAIAQTSYELGEGLWRVGDPKSAHATLLAGVPKRFWPAHTLGTGFERVATPPLAAAGLDYEKPAALGDPGRNLFLAGAIVSAAGKRDLAREYLKAAAATGLPEASRMLAREATSQRAAR